MEIIVFILILAVTICDIALYLYVLKRLRDLERILMLNELKSMLKELDNNDKEDAK